MSDFMKVVEVDLPDEGWVIFVFEIFGEYLLSKLPDVLDCKGSFMFIVKYDIFIFFVLFLQK